ncbi:hypothetical protein M758_6G025700 [Ceratodon purpureus]|uniref:Uncharacterized protein n=1 Tax=Ceratodon purpureus TaxID=3225 RepID=A0A8T0HD25_CERPU|nr:hypothetical protein KC19_6G028600 [Ceratodon purpureus]KAG0612413.1 hypothetical protein M758_6G025700 [Ceratodon purpureus]
MALALKCHIRLAALPWLIPSPVGGCSARNLEHMTNLEQDEQFPSRRSELPRYMTP